MNIRNRLPEEVTVTKRPLYLLSATVMDGSITCDLCPFHIRVGQPWRLMDAHMEKHTSGRWTGK